MKTTQKKETENEKENFPPAPLYKEKDKEKEKKTEQRREEKKKKSRPVKNSKKQSLLAFGPNTRSVWAKHRQRLG